MQNRKTIVYLLTICVIVESAMFLWLCRLGSDAFVNFIWTPDTPEYVRVATQLADSFTLSHSYRTLGYPLFLAMGYFAAGPIGGTYVTIAAQLAINIAFTWGCWRLLERAAPDAAPGLRAFATIILFWAGLGMALFLMTDFLAAVLFAVFLYGIIFWRHPMSLFVSGMALALATLTRPTFTFLPFLMPFIVYFVGRFSSKVPRSHIGTFLVCSIVATGISVLYQYTGYKYIGPSPVFTIPVEQTIYYGVLGGDASGRDFGTFNKEFEAEVERRSDRKYATMAPSERDQYASQIFREAFRSHPVRIIAQLVENFVKYLFVPIESIVMRFTKIYTSEDTYLVYVRPVLSLICLPLWLVAFIPPFGAAKSYKMYYLLVGLLLIYVIALSATSTGSGERIRFPLLVFLLPVMMWNLTRAGGWLHAVRDRFLNRTVISSGEA